jgi:hypothetical protein
MKNISRFTKLRPITRLDVPRSVERIGDFSERSSRLAVNMSARGSLRQHWVHGCRRVAALDIPQLIEFVAGSRVKLRIKKTSRL